MPTCSWDGLLRGFRSRAERGGGDKRNERGREMTWGKKTPSQDQGVASKPHDEGEKVGRLWVMLV